MKKILSIFMSLVLVSALAFAKAGSSVSRSSSSSSSSSGVSKSSSSYGSTSSSTQASTQYSSTASRPSAPSSTSSATQGSTSSGNSTPRPNSPTTSQSSSVGNSTPSGTTTNTHTIERDSGGLGMGGTILGTAVGATLGTVVGNSINGNHGGVVASNGNGGYNNGGNYNSAPQNNGGTYNYPQNTSNSVNNTNNASSSWSFFGILMTILGLMFKALLFVALVWGCYWLYKQYKSWRYMKKPEDREKFLETFKSIFIEIQSIYTIDTKDTRVRLAKLCTPEMYDYLRGINSENEEKGYSTVTKQVEVLSITTTGFTGDEGVLYHSAKIRSSMIDYTISSSTKEVVEGSESTPIEDIEVWTFVSENSGKSWRLSAIEQYVK